MSVRRLYDEQPESFAFTPENQAWAREQIAKYPDRRQASAVISLLWRAQEQAGGWLPEPAIRHVADMLSMAYIRVYEVATFYTMFNLAPVGRYHVQLCGTTPCWLRGADDLKAVCRKVIGEQNRPTEDGTFSWVEVECLGACVNAPMVQINKDYYEDLDAESFERLLADLKAGKSPAPGPQIDRINSAPEGGPQTLVEPDLYNGNYARLWAKSKGKAGDEGEAKDAPAPKAEPATKTAQATKTAPAKAAETASGGDDAAKQRKPRGLKAPRKAGADDLKLISGVGPKIEGLLNDLGIYHYDQIAKWGEEEVAWVDDYLRFKGRIAREGWIGQAETLAKGGETEFSRRKAKKGS
ncbi:NADH-quinone oxidoreductase subunit NuoE [Kaustia mangrovi]|uniref:NADH-quinone oxidoreductase subunit NuoE n=1 Tax=Kaustia mangrovi TaxID=2593653 RepID=A0A7S8HDS8_9HYPH|nr:NADH-quinone oxidoreductase subunit NuoE [Kaustia mangrovi]QPC44804.1 NADH-quinone oxidoreductase subunit NuoE [Kaustia mangrovi]